MKSNDMAKHMNIVDLKPRPEVKEGVIEAHKQFDLRSWDGALSLKLIDWGEWVCGVIEWQSKEDMEQAMPKFGLFLDQWRENLQEISSKLGVTDAISGVVVTEL